MEAPRKRPTNRPWLRTKSQTLRMSRTAETGLPSLFAALPKHRKMSLMSSRNEA
jgi:hypothetical protein